MESNRNFFLNKHLNTTQFKRKGGPKKGKWQNSDVEWSAEDSHASDTIYRILCQSKKIGSVIGKGGGIVKALREETQAKITVADTVPGSDERVIIVMSPSAKLPRRQTVDNDQDAMRDGAVMDPHCAAQDALLKVHDRIVKEDLGGTDNNENEIIVTARLLVPNNMVGCLLGKKGDVIQRLRGETRANIRVLPADHLPSCAMTSDELVQISGKPTIARKALYEVSTLLHQNPRKDKPPLSFPLGHGTQNLHPSGSPMSSMPPAVHMWSHRNPHEQGMPMPWAERLGNQPSGLGPSDFDGLPSTRGAEAPCEFSMKILCSAAKIGGVIGKGGFNVRQLEQETGARIQVENISPELDERVICISSMEVLWNPRSQTIDAILHLQNKTSELNEKGFITTRLLVPSSKVGCILGQGGNVINEMRKRTQADIRVFSKEDKPKCASDDEELVQISGSPVIAKDALAEIATRLRTRCLRDANAKGESAPTRPVSGFVPGGNLPSGGLPPSGAMGGGSLGRYEHFKGGGLDHEPPSYSVPPTVMGYPGISNDRRIRNNIADSIVGAGTSSVGEIVGSRMKLYDRHGGGTEHVMDIRQSSEHLSGGQSMFPPFGSSTGHNSHTLRNSYPSYTNHGVYQSINSFNPSPSTYQNIPTEQNPYQNMSGRGSFRY